MIKERSFGQRLGAQFTALMRKNLLLGYRNWRATIIQLCASFIFLVLLLLIVVAYNSDQRSSETCRVVRDPKVQSISAVPSCSEDLYVTRSDCVDIVYTPSGDPTVEAIIERIRLNNPGRVIPADKVKSFATPDDADAWMFANPDTAISAVHFQTPLSPTVMNFGIQTNSTPKFFKGQYRDPNTFVRLPLQSAVQREVVRQMVLDKNGQDAANALQWDMQWSSFPHPALQVVSIEGQAGSFFIFAAAMFGFVIQIVEIVTEKEFLLRQSMRTMGMLDLAFWLSWQGWHFIYNFVSALMLCVFGVILDFKLFRRNNFGVVFLVILLFMQAMTGFAYVVAAFLKRSQSATILGFGLLLVGWIFLVVIQFGVPFTPQYWYVPNHTYILTIVFGIFPWSFLAKSLSDLGSASSGDYQGLNIGEVNSYCMNYHNVPSNNLPGKCYPSDPGKYVDCDCVIPIGTMYWIFIVHWVGYVILGIYLDNVLPSESGTRRMPWFFLSPSYWLTGVSDRMAHGKSGLRSLAAIHADHADCFSADEDVLGEMERAKARLVALQQGDEGLASDAEAVELFAIRKVFYGRGKPFEAVKGSWFSIHRGELFCLLGPNGAGKTTTINMLTGVLPPSAGEALIYGEVLRSAGGLDRIRSMMGVCPQFDVLWDRLTGREHMHIYAQIKGVDPAMRGGHIEDLLDRVRLTSAAGQHAGGYSGGMKRRLSVAIALMGDPKVVYLDEPTTGMDPISRRHVWDIVEAAKKDRAIVLTTHSMEEADILGARIAIMARGALRCVGSSIRLKSRFGAGYQIAMAVGHSNKSSPNLAQLESRRENLKNIFRNRLGVAPFDDTGSYVTFVVPRDRHRDAVSVLEHLERNRSALGITDIQLSMASLEEVFLAIAKAAEVEEAAKQGSAMCPYALSDGTTLMIPMGADEFIDAQGTRFKVVWAQGEDGTLQIMDLRAQAA